MSRLVVLSDFSEQSDLATKNAVELGKHLGEDVHIVYMDSYIYSLKQNKLISCEEYQSYPGLAYKVHPHNTKLLDGYLSRNKLKIDQVEINILETDKFSDLQRYIDETETALLMVSLDENELNGKLFFGSFFSKLITELRTNLLVVKKNMKHPMRKIAVCTDLERDDHNLISQGISVAKQMDCSMEIFHGLGLKSNNPIKNNVFSDSSSLIDKYLEKINLRLDGLKAEVESNGISVKILNTVSLDKSTYEIINDQFTNNPVDLVFLEPHILTNRAMDHGGVSWQLLKNSPFNFFIVQED